MKTIFLLLFSFLGGLILAQTGGTTTFPMLDLSFSARSTGLAGDFISVYDEDINMGISNPSLINSEMSKTASFSTALLSGGVNYGMFAYGLNSNKLGPIATYIKYVSYGKFDRMNEAGISEGTFKPFEMIAGAGIGKTLNPRISIGANVNFLYSQLETYSSLGASVDFAGTFFNPEKEFLVTILAKNIGYQLKGYTEKTRSPLPVEIQAATSYKLKHAPFRISLLAHHLNQWDITYNDPNAKETIDALTGDTIPVSRAGFFEKFANHFTYQLEVLITKNIEIRAGFDYHKRKELALEQRSGIAGFSFGAGLLLDKFRLDYGFVVYSRAGFNNMITLSTNLSKWKK